MKLIPFRESILRAPDDPHPDYPTIRDDLKAADVVVAYEAGTGKADMLFGREHFAGGSDPDPELTVLSFEYAPDDLVMLIEVVRVVKGHHEMWGTKERFPVGHAKFSGPQMPCELN